MSGFDWDILLPALAAGLLILSTHVPFGMRVLQRGVIFADIAVAQIAGLGVVMAGLAGLEQQPWLVQGVAVASALCGAAVLAWLERAATEVKEAGIGLAFVLAATLGILLMSRDVHAGEHLKDMLVGQILWVSNTQLLATGLLSAVVLLAWRVLRARQGHFVFYALFALVVTASVQLAGIYLVFASLIVPALATHKLKRWRLQVAYAVGIAGYVLGLLVSVWLDLPAGAAIVWMLVLSGAPVLLRPARA